MTPEQVDKLINSLLIALMVTCYGGAIILFASSVYENLTYWHGLRTVWVGSILQMNAIIITILFVYLNFLGGRGDK